MLLQQRTPLLVGRVARLSQYSLFSMNWQGGGGGRQYNSRNNHHRGRGRSGRGAGRGRGGGHHHHHRNNRNNNSGQAFENHPNNNYNGWGNRDTFHMIESSGSPSSTSFNVAVQGCSHGELDSIYDALEVYRVGKLDNNSIDVLLCCGDVQTLRNTDDFHSLNVPPKYKRIGDFHQYYSGQKVAPILTIMIGGNHEASNYLQELHYGGWVAPNIFYLGAAGVINIFKKTSSSTMSSLRIAGISGIYTPHHYKLGRFEVPPYGQSEIRSVYHTREVEVKRLQALASMNERPIDIFLSHDWPRGIYHHGNVNNLLKKKPFFHKEVLDNALGSPANEQLLHLLRPRYWFSAHLHVKFSAQVQHQKREDTDNIADLKKDSDDATKISASSSGAAVIQDQCNEESNATEFHGMESNDCPDANIQSLTEQMTRFLSLDKCLPKRHHIQVIHVEPSESRSFEGGEIAAEDAGKPWLEYDLPWLSILGQTHEWTQRTRKPVNLINENVTITKEQLQRLEISLKVKNKGGFESCPLAIPLNFSVTVRPFDPSARNQSYNAPSQLGNPQTDEFLSMMDLTHKITVPFSRVSNARGEGNNARTLTTSLRPSQVRVNNYRAVNDDNEIDLDGDCVADGINEPKPKMDDNEIDLDDDNDDGDADDINEQITVSAKPVDPSEIEIDDTGDDECFVSKRPKL